MEIAYKLVLKLDLDDSYVRNQIEFVNLKKDIFTSLSRHYPLTYKVNEITKPMVGKMFVFSNTPNRYQVQSCIGISEKQLRIFKCEVDVLEDCRSICYNDRNSITKFWGLNLHLIDIHDPSSNILWNQMPPIMGTKLCNECKLIEDITESVMDGFWA